jgi:hypothetical protein
MTAERMSTDRRRAAYVLLCEGATTSASGTASYIGVFDRIHADKFPAQHPGFVVAARLNGDPGTTETLQIVYRDSQSADMMPPLGPLTVTYSPYGAANVHVDIKGLPVLKYGIFQIGFVSSGRLLGSTILYVEPTRENKP